jgi:hypothetical protein
MSLVCFVDTLDFAQYELGRAGPIVRKEGPSFRSLYFLSKQGWYPNLVMGGKYTHIHRN